MKESRLFQFSDQIKIEDLGNGIKRQLYDFNGQLMMVKVIFDKGAIGSLHHHQHTKVTYVESGVFEMMIGDKKETISKGDGFYVPPYEIHGIICLEPSVLIDVFSPVREDFLEL
nr:cupin domain-containing protein [Pseudopedobacter sp.]